MKRRLLTIREEQAYRLCSGDFEGLTQVEAAKKMGISQTLVNRLLERVGKKCPSLLPIHPERPKCIRYEDKHETKIVEKF